MNREIKFRAWDKSKKYFIYFGEEYWFNDEENTLTFQCTNVIGDHDDGTRFVFQQYTGLKDKNGKEIYEGDIVKYRWPKEEVEYGNPVLVQWSINLGGFILVDPKDEWFDGLFYASPEYEVISNIYENSELLK